jgi:two-component system, response regulator
MDDKYTLLVEDNPDEVVLTKLAFKKGQIPHHLVVVCDGQEALDYIFCRNSYAARNPDEKPAIILLDLKLPLVSGMDVLKEIKANDSTCSIPVIILTSSNEYDDEYESCRLGANDYCRKPTGFSEFIRVIQGIRSRWLDSNDGESAFQDDSD